MPTAEQILAGLSEIANNWPLVATLWHVFFAGLAVALIANYRPSRRETGLYLVLPFISVSGLGWLYGMPFIGASFAFAGLLLYLTTFFLGREEASPGPVWMIAAGAILFATGWVYPHFLDTVSNWPYAYRGPAGLIPCPTLLVLIGFTLALGGLGSSVWCWTLVTLGLAYGLMGTLWLGVTLDWALVTGAVVLAITSFVPLTGTAAAPDAPSQRGDERVAPRMPA